MEEINMGKFKENIINEDSNRLVYEVKYECPKCKYQLIETGYRYCPNCGVKLTRRLKK